MALKSFNIRSQQIPRRPVWIDLDTFINGRYRVIMNAQIEWDDPAGKSQTNPVAIAIDLDASNSNGTIRSWDNPAFLRFDERTETQDSKSRSRRTQKTVTVNLDQTSLLKLMLVDQSRARTKVDYYLVECSISLEDI